MAMAMGMLGCYGEELAAEAATSCSMASGSLKGGPTRASQKYFQEQEALEYFPLLASFLYVSWSC
jgi:hypothetical protein